MVPITTGFKQTPTTWPGVRVRLYLFPHGCPAEQSGDLLPSAKPPALLESGGWPLRSVSVYVCC